MLRISVEEVARADLTGKAVQAKCLELPVELGGNDGVASTNSLLIYVCLLSRWERTMCGIRAMALSVYLFC